MVDKVIIAGVGMVPFATPSRSDSYAVLAESAVRAALADAGVGLKQVRQVYAGYVYGDSTSGQNALYPVGMTGVPVINVNNNCATGSSALFLARQAIASGVADCVLALGFEQMQRGALKEHANLLGSEGEGFHGLTGNLPRERISIAVAALAQSAAALRATIDYVRERAVFGNPIGALQNTRFRVAELVTEIDIAQQFVDRCILELNDGELTPVDAAKAKWWITELQGRTMDTCVQLHGGYGYMLEYPIARAWADSRVSRIYGGTTEIMKELIGRSLQLDGHSEGAR
jgi:acyl-CoA dehydrogenase-like protein/thiolase-like protein